MEKRLIKPGDRVVRFSPSKMTPDMGSLYISGGKFRGHEVTSTHENAVSMKIAECNGAPVTLTVAAEECLEIEEAVEHLLRTNKLRHKPYGFGYFCC